MEIGDLIYVILLLLFMILGFFNDSRKKKEQQKQQQETTPGFNSHDQETSKTLPPVLTEEQKRRFELEREKRLKQINREREKRVKEGETVFRSSLDLVTDFSKESSLGGSIYKNDTGGLYDQDEEAFYNAEVNSIHGLHPLVEDLNGENLRRELVKGVLYSEILKRKY